jgi:glycolate oxidase FAD binding subunit
MAEIEGLLSQNRQMLAFEPMDMGALLGGASGGQTLAGVVSCNLSGPRRIKAGAARDHVLGIKGVSGRGELFKSGGRVVKNVTGYDLSKLLTGSYGTLAALTEVTVKVLPAPEKTRTILAFGTTATAGCRALTEAAGSPHEVAGLAWLPAAAAARSEVSYVRDAGTSVAAVRIEGPGPSVEHRCKALRELLGRHGQVEELHSMNSASLWREVRDVASLLPVDGRAVWRVSVAPTAGPQVLAQVEAGMDVDALFDWAGGLLWLSVPEAGDAGAAAIRGAVGRDGHATLVRAPEQVRARVPVFQPQPTALAALSRRVKQAFDPLGLLNPGRMYGGGES